MVSRIVRQIYKILISLQLAVVLLTLLTVALIVATFIESKYDTPTAQYYVYQATWFSAVLFFLGLNILSVALSRLPWKARHAPFLLAHLGILLLLVGSWVTRKYGLDGMMRVGETEVQSIVEESEPQIVIKTEKKIQIIPFRWMPPSVHFERRVLPYGLVVEEYLSRADPIFSFIESASPQARPALQLKFSTKRSMGGMPAMAASQEIWLWEGLDGWRENMMGPARVIFGGAKPDQPGPWIWLNSAGKRKLEYEALSMRQERTKGALLLQDSKAVLDVGWKAVQVEVLKFLDRAVPKTDFVPAKIQYGASAPPSAIRIRGPRLPNAEEGELVWLGMGDRASFQVGGESVEVLYGSKRVYLPFSLRLDRFILERYPGSTQPSSFASRVTVDPETKVAHEHLISMNEPLVHRGITFYQSSYEDAYPRPTVSVFSVNRDPARWLKYLGSLILVLGVIYFYVERSRRNRVGRAGAKKEAMI